MHRRRSVEPHLRVRACRHRHVFELALSFFVSPLADAPTQDAIMQLLEAAVRLSAGQKALLRYC